MTIKLWDLLCCKTVRSRDVVTVLSNMLSGKQILYSHAAAVLHEVTLRAAALQAEMCAGTKMRFTSLSPIVSPVQRAALFQTAQVRTTGGLLLACTLTFLVEHITC